MIPIGDSTRRRTTPYVNVGIIIACVLVFLYELSLSTVDVGRFFQDWGVVPVQLVDWLESPSVVEEPSTVVTSMFIHGGWLHLIGNMLFLWVFGDNVEDAMGHGRYLVFYLLAGLAATALQVFIDQESLIPMVGASGAIAGVLGAYLVLYPRATVSVLIPWLWFFGAFPVPAAFLIVFWFLLQLLSGVASLGADSGATEGIAFWAHVGGFIAGVVLVWAFRRQKPRRRRPPAVVW
ncbi:MAG: rhomboid family intramembrane serine protease [Chloroflexi bacterium]|nr:rhomboid family intramembrane serine protease [Chloroflexota bacterium]